MALPLRCIAAPLLAGLLLAAGLTAAPTSQAAPASDRDAGDPTITAVVDQRTRAILRADSTARISDSGRLYYVEPAVDAGEITPEAAEAAPYPYADTFSLHSLPGSEHVIFLDFDGASVQGTAWGDGGDGNHPAWDPAGNGAGFTHAEQDAIQSIWARVAEDYAPFDVDVTTEDPGGNRLRQPFSTHVVISPAPSAWSGLCAQQCGGIAWTDAFRAPIEGGQYYGPTFVFTGGSSDDPKSVGEVASHEAGHTFGLEHDGRGSNPYYSGHAHWAPIMGDNYYRPVTQWSLAQVVGRGVVQDGVAVLAASADGSRADEAGPSISSAAPLPPSGDRLFEDQAFITSADDVDVFALGTCSGQVSLDARPAAVSPNLDIALTLLDAQGNAVDTHAPVTGANGYETDSVQGMSARIQRTVSIGQYYVAVDGSGSGGVSPAYSDYGSLGGYTIAQTGCDAVAPEPDVEDVPSVPRAVQLSSSPDGKSLTATWQRPASEGNAPLTRYDIQFDDRPVVQHDSNTTSITFTGLAEGSTHTVSLRAVNALGPSDPGTATATTFARPGAVRSLTGSMDASGFTQIRWSAPATDGGTAITGYDVVVNGTSQPQLAPNATGVDLTLQTGQVSTVIVTAVNSVGSGPTSSVTIGVPDRPRILRASSGRFGGAATFTVRWRLAESGGAAAFIQVRAHKLNARGRVVRSYTSELISAARSSVTLRAPTGRYVLAVRAGNDSGWSRFSQQSNVVRAR